MLTPVCGAMLAVPALGAGLTDRNSVKIEFISEKSFRIEGTGCGASATGSVTLGTPPRGVSKAFGVKVAKPAVGQRDGYVRVTAVRVADQTVTVTATAEPGPCSADGDSSEPPARRSWSANFAPDVSFFRRVQAHLRSDAYKKRPRLKAPRSMRLFGGDTLTGIRWKGFGSKTARATARYRIRIPGTRCTPRLCRGHNGRVKLKFGKVKRCSDAGVYEYTSMSIRFRGRLLSSAPAFCS